MSRFTYDGDYDVDPEQEDAANNHGQSEDISMEEVLGKPPAPVSDYYEDIALLRCSNCQAWVYRRYGAWYDYNSGVAHTCLPKPSTTTKPSFAKERTMNNNVKVISTSARGISASSLSIGEYGRIVGKLDPREGDIVLKAGTSVVNLSNPELVWEESSFTMPFVERLNTGDKVEITVGLTADFETRIRTEASSNKIRAIKSVREATNWGLTEAKNYVDGLLLTLTPKF